MPRILEAARAASPVRSCDLLVTVDTEEEGLWTDEFRRHGNTVENLRGLPRFQQLCEQFDLVPTYLVDTPVLQCDRTVQWLADLQRRQRCEVGGHLHPWCAPPFEEEISQRNSYMCNLPESLQGRKLETLTNEIGERIGYRPTSFRAGRYGLDIVGAKLLGECGYIVDSSVVPFRDYSDEGGPNFDNAECHPYCVGGSDLCQAQDDGVLLEAPVSTGFNRRDFQAAHRIRRRFAQSALRKLRIVGALDRLGILRSIKFSPEQATAKEMKKLVDMYLMHDAPCMVMMLHSSSLAPGYTPYVQDRGQLEAFFDRLATTFEYCKMRGMVGRTLSAFADRFKINDPQPNTTTSSCT